MEPLNPAAQKEKYMEKLKMHSPDLTHDNIARIRAPRVRQFSASKSLCSL